MPFHLEWVVTLDDAAKSTTDTPLSPRTAQNIIDALTGLRIERDGLRDEVAKKDEELKTLESIKRIIDRDSR